MQKIFKIERLRSSYEFKDKKKALQQRRKKAKMARKLRESVDLDKMIAAQTKLHNEEKVMLLKIVCLNGLCL